MNFELAHAASAPSVVEFCDILLQPAEEQPPNHDVIANDENHQHTTSFEVVPNTGGDSMPSKWCQMVPEGSGERNCSKCGTQCGNRNPATSSKWKDFTSWLALGQPSQVQKT